MPLFDRSKTLLASFFAVSEDTVRLRKPTDLANEYYKIEQQLNEARTPEERKVLEMELSEARFRVAEALVEFNNWKYGENKRLRRWQDKDAGRVATSVHVGTQCALTGGTDPKPGQH